MLGALAAVLTVITASATLGDLDTTFDSDGKVITDFGTSDIAHALAIQADGKIVAVGECAPGGTVDFCLARYNVDGSLDTSFDADGKVTTGIATLGDIAHGAVIQSDGKIVVAGGCFSGVGFTFCLARYNADGSLDTSFDGDGKVITTPIGNNSYDVATAVAIQPDGKIVAAGQCNTNINLRYCLARYNADGSLDTSFDGDGKVLTDVAPGADGYLYGLANQADGKIIVSGTCTGSMPKEFCLARYNTDGSLDGSFGSGGIVTADVGSRDDVAFAVTIQADGKILAAGYCDTVAVPYYPRFCLARYNTDGSLDALFGTGGKTTTDFTGSSEAHAVALQTNGQIVAVGYCFINVPNSPTEFCLARYSADGSIDNSFGTAGRVTTAISGDDGAYAAAIQSNGRIVAAGFCSAGGPPYNFCLARYNATGAAVGGVVELRSDHSSQREADAPRNSPPVVWLTLFGLALIVGATLCCMREMESFH